jgi:hypothetical protein
MNATITSKTINASFARAGTRVEVIRKCADDECILPNAYIVRFANDIRMRLHALDLAIDA